MYQVKITRADLWGNFRDGFDNNGEYEIANFKTDVNRVKPVKIAREHFAYRAFALTETSTVYVGKNSKAVTVEWVNTYDNETFYDILYRGQYVGSLSLKWLGASTKNGLTYTFEDVKRCGESRYLEVDEKRLAHNPLPWQKRGLMYTQSGYGKRIPTENMIRFNGRLHRVYCCIFSNSGTLYIEHKGEWIIVRV